MRWRDAGKREVWAVGLTIVAVSVLALGGRSGGDDSAAPPTPPSTVAPTAVASTAPATTEPRPEPTAPSSTLAPSPSSTLAPSTSSATVTRVIDGDTLVLDDGRHVRLAQVDAPETNQCFGSQATAALRDLVDGKPVELRRPPDAPTKDRYGRTVAEVVVDGVSADEELIRQGAATFYRSFAHEDLDLARRLEAAEAEAASAGRGLWTACRRGTTAPPPTAPPTTIPTAPPPAETTTGTRDDCHPAYPDDCIPPAPPDLDCGSAAIRHVVRVDHTHGDPHRFDADRDGFGCESYG